MGTKKHRSSWQKVVFVVILALAVFNLPSPSINKVGATTVLHVPSDYATIQAALNAALPGDTILVGLGTYVENINFNGKDVTLRSEAGAEATRVKHAPSYNTPVVTIGPGGKVIGFTVSDGDVAASIVVVGNGTIIQANIFENNFGPYSAISSSNGSPIIEGNIFRNNGYISSFCVATVVMSSDDHIVSPQIKNNIFINNLCRAMYLNVPTGSSPQVINNTIIGNWGGIYIALLFTDAIHIYRNNIIYQNDVGLEVDDANRANYILFENNLVFGNHINYQVIPDQTGLNGNISTNPFLMANSQPPGMMRASSPAIDAGTNDLCPATDFLGRTRPEGSKCDMGAFEFGAGITFSQDNYSVNESDGTIQIPVFLYPAQDHTISIDYSTSYTGAPGEAVPGSDYTPTGGTLTFPAGIQQKSFSIPIVNDIIVESDETISLILSNVSGTQNFIANDMATVRISADPFSSFTFGSTSYVVNETDGSVLVTVSLNPPMQVAATVNYATVYSGGPHEATPGSDYIANNGILTFPAGSQQESFIIPLIDDDIGEYDETVSLALSNPLSTDEVNVGNSASVTIKKDSDWRSFYLPLCSNRFCPDLFDNFNNVYSGWPFSDNAYVRSEYFNDEFRVLSKQAGYFFMFTAPACERMKYSVEMDARWAGASGNSYGIVFALSGDYDSYYIFDMNTDYQMYRLLRIDANGLTMPISPTYVSLINTGSTSNHLQVIWDGIKITLYINSVDVRWWYNTGISGLTRVGLMSSSYSDVPTSDARFDNFQFLTLTGYGTGIGDFAAPFDGSLTITGPVLIVDKGTYATGSNFPGWR